MKKTSLIFFILLVIVFTTTGCDESDPSENYEIRGSWDITFTSGGESLSALMVFSGTKETGNILINFTFDGESCSHSGTYTVVQDKKVTIIWITAEPCLEAGNIIMDGEFSDEDTITGTAEASMDPGKPFPWTARRR